MGFSQAVSTGLKKYVTFSGRAGRSEYWYFVLFNILVAVVANIVDGIVGTKGMLSMVASLALVLPTLAVFVRRLHDLNKSGWWLLIELTGIGALVLLYWACQKGDAAANKFGTGGSAA